MGIPASRQNKTPRHLPKYAGWPCTNTQPTLAWISSFQILSQTVLTNSVYIPNKFGCLDYKLTQDWKQQI